jgi:hypothetical protein
MSDELRTHLKNLDPMAPSVPTEAATAPSSRHRMERVMSTPTQERPQAPVRTRKPWALTASVAAAALVIVGVASLLGNNALNPDLSPAVELSLGGGESLESCLAFDTATLATMPMAFEGTATAVDGDLVRLEVDRWYRGGDAAEVALIGTAGLEALIGGVGFEVGDEYLITATDGNVNYCGYSGEATPDLRAAFDEAFGG